MMATRADRIRTRRHLIDALYARGDEADSNTLEVFISRLRVSSATTIFRHWATGCRQKAVQMDPSFERHQPLTLPRSMSRGRW